MCEIKKNNITNLKINARLDVKKGQGHRLIQLSDIKIADSDDNQLLYFPHKKASILDLFDFDPRKNKINPNDEHLSKICKELASLVPQSRFYNYFADKQPIYNDIVSTICNKLYYYLSDGQRKTLIENPKIMKFIIDYDLEKILQNLPAGDELKIHKNHVPKYIPSTIVNKDIKIQKSDGTYTTLDSKFDIIFDSGNSSVTLIGENIVNSLGLKRLPGCKISSQGIGGKSGTCGEFCIIKFKFTEGTAMTNDHEYEIAAFIDDKNIKNTLLFGHANGLDLLFNHNYSIKNRYNINDIRNTIDVKESEETHEIYDVVLKILENFSIYHKLECLKPLKKLNKNGYLRTSLHEYNSKIDINTLTSVFKLLKQAQRQLEEQKEEKYYQIISEILKDIV